MLSTIKTDILLEALKKVYDPELQFDIVSLGLVYRLEEKDGEVEIDLTMTSPHCPLAAQIAFNAENELLKVEGVKKVKLNLVWSPPWKPEMMSDEAKAVLGIF